MALKFNLTCANTSYVSNGQCLKQNHKGLMLGNCNITFLNGQTEPISFRVRDNHQVFINFHYIPPLVIYESQSDLFLAFIHQLVLRFVKLIVKLKVLAVKHPGSIKSLRGNPIPSTKVKRAGGRLRIHFVLKASPGAVVSPSLHFTAVS